VALSYVSVKQWVRNGCKNLTVIKLCFFMMIMLESCAGDEWVFYIAKGEYVRNEQH